MSASPPRFDPDRLRALRQGDRTAKEAFFEHFYDRVYAFVLGIVRGVDLAEDLTHEAFLRMHGALERLDETRDPAPWVFTIAANVVRDHWRRKHHRVSRKQIDVDELWNEPVSDGPAPDAALLAREEDELIQRALEQLSPGDRELIVLKAWEGLETEELSEVLGVNAAAIRQRWSRAVRRLGEAYRRTKAEDTRRS